MRASVANELAGPSRRKRADRIILGSGRAGVLRWLVEHGPSPGATLGFNDSGAQRMFTDMLRFCLIAPCDAPEGIPCNLPCCRRVVDPNNPNVSYGPDRTSRHRQLRNWFRITSRGRLALARYNLVAVRFGPHGGTVHIKLTALGAVRRRA